jgi:deoxyribodipyrimidine photo-lyase
MRALLWFQNDLRMSDHAGLCWISDNEIAFAGLVFEPKTESKFQRTFFWQSVESLRYKLKAHSVPLYVFNGEPEQVIPALSSANTISLIVKSSASNSVDKQQEESIQKIGLQLQFFEAQTLLPSLGLPFPVSKLPSVFTEFRKPVEKEMYRRTLVIPPQFENPKKLKGLSLTTPPEVSFAEPSESCALPFGFNGSEEAGRKRLEDFLWNSKAALTYKETRNGMLELNDSTKFSPWLSTGALSARTIYWELKQFEQEHGANDSTYWIFFELLWRDYFKFLAQKIGPRLFERKGLLTADRAWEWDAEVFENWKLGKTNSPFVNANMKELLLTGWMSNRGRQNVASYLAKTLGLDWTFGARWFEDQLLDFDRESNWGNWLYQSGMGTDPRDRVFDVDRQARLYDPNGVYQKKWLT